MVEAHQPGGHVFGVECLTVLIGRHASEQLEPEEIVRLIVRSILDYKTEPVADDATLVLVRWNGPRRTQGA